MRTAVFALVVFSSLSFGVVATSNGSAATLEREQSFDEGWRFYRGELLNAEHPEFDDQSWRSLDLPHDWSIEDLPADNSDPQRRYVLRLGDGEWMFSEGDKHAWSHPEHNDRDWQKINLPASWKEHSNYDAANAFGWYRKHVKLSADQLNHDLTVSLGVVMGADETYFNGVRIGGVGSFPPQFEDYWSNVYQTERTYRVPASLVKQTNNVVAVRVYSPTPGRGGMYDEGGKPVAREIVGPFDPTQSLGANSTGFTVGGEGWYRKRFTLPAETHDKAVSIRFDGVYMNSDAWLNGHHLGNHPYGYTSFVYDLTNYLAPTGQPNVLTVRVRNIGANSRWYSGSGIYRHTWLTITEPIHVAPWGVHVATPHADKANAVVQIDTTLAYPVQKKTQNIFLKTRVIAPDGTIAAESERIEVRLALQAEQQKPIVQTLTVENPRLWGPSSPTLYQAQTVVENSEGTKLDEVKTTFGIRTVKVDAERGFQLNGETIKLKGGCIHHDNGPLGAKAIDRAEARKLELLKAAGYNAIRSSHNPPSPALLDAADRLGILVIDEAFDHWQDQKNPDDYHKYFDQWWQKDVNSMVLRDRNHPSVVMWSIGNEIPERETAKGARTAKNLANYIRGLDRSRPITSALHKVTDKSDAYIAALDVAGYNYIPERFELDHQRHPQRVMLTTESFPRELYKYWQAVEEMPWVIGDFVWTSVDYIGEAGIGHANEDTQLQSYLRPWPWNLANCGDINICGGKNPQSYYRDVVWRQSPIEMAVHVPLPTGRQEVLGPWGWPEEERHWNWQGREGQLMEVKVYTRHPEVRLLLNGKVIGQQKITAKDELTAHFNVPFSPGELRAVAIVDGKEKESIALQTTGQPVKLRLTPEMGNRLRSRAEGDLGYFVVEALDKNDRVVPNARASVKFRAEGDHELAGVCNANPTDTASYLAPSRELFRGRATVVLRPKSTVGSHDVDSVLFAESEGLEPARLIIGKSGKGRELTSTQ